MGIIIFFSYDRKVEGEFACVIEENLVMSENQISAKIRHRRSLTEYNSITLSVSLGEESWYYQTAHDGKAIMESRGKYLLWENQLLGTVLLSKDFKVMYFDFEDGRKIYVPSEEAVMNMFMDIPE
ncbi:MAG: hypothetical protein JEZ08_22475 [Clostridiales bacterium]|nr:hypothetical protein [Clostridiales bacterium]